MENKHLIELDELSGDEYMMGDIDGYIPDINYFFERAGEIMKPIRYSQLEFKDMPTTLCTLYGNMNALASRIGRELTTAERRELCQLRLADKDYRPEFGGYTSAGCDTVRRWFNTHNQDTPVITFAIDVNSDLGKKFFSKNFPIATSVRLNSSYSKDAADGMLNETSWGTSTGGHCRMRIGMKFHDNYIVSKKWREYEYPNVGSYMESVKNGFERQVFYAFFLEKELSGDGKKLVDAMRKGWWNGSREKDNLTRFEASAIAFRIGQGKVPQELIWNQKGANDAVSRYEFSVMINRVDNTKCIYLGTDRNKLLTRKEAILLLS